MLTFVVHPARSTNLAVDVTGAGLVNRFRELVNFEALFAEMFPADEAFVGKHDGAKSGMTGYAQRRR
jgi:hypothetical protein